MKNPKDGRSMYDEAEAVYRTQPDYHIFGSQCGHVAARILDAGNISREPGIPNFSFHSTEVRNNPAEKLPHSIKAI